MTEFKYTTDGRKVVVIGNLNAQEKIVQEVFLVGGQEMPSGENFVVKSLHSAPAISWKEQQIKEMDAKYTEAKSRSEKLEKELRSETSRLNAKLLMIKELADNVTNEGFKMVSDVLSGQVKWVVCGEEYSPELIPFDKYEETRIVQNDSYSFEGFRLLGLYGGRYSADGHTYESYKGERPKGDLQWRIHGYSDGSGSSRPIYLFTEKAEALEKFRTLIEGRDYTDERVKLLVENGLPLDEKKLAKLRSKQYGQVKGKIIALEKELESVKAKFSEMELPS